MNAVTQPLSLSEIQELAANYSDRQGLRIVPIGLAVLVQALGRWPAQIFGIDSVAVALAAGFLGYWLAGRYYRRRFGTVEELPYEGLSLWTHLALVLIAFIASLVVDLLLRPPVFVSGLVIAIWLAVTAWPAVRVRGQYTSIAITLALISLMPLLGDRLPGVGRTYGVVFGAMLLWAGVRDHLEFVRAFPRLEQQHEQ